MPKAPRNISSPPWSDTWWDTNGPQDLSALGGGRSSSSSSSSRSNDNNNSNSNPRGAASSSAALPTITAQPAGGSVRGMNNLLSSSKPGVGSLRARMPHASGSSSSSRTPLSSLPMANLVPFTIEEDGLQFTGVSFTTPRRTKRKIKDNFDGENVQRADKKAAKSKGKAKEDDGMIELFSDRDDEDKFALDGFSDVELSDEDEEEHREDAAYLGDVAGDAATDVVVEDDGWETGEEDEDEDATVKNPRIKVTEQMVDELDHLLDKRRGRPFDREKDVLSQDEIKIAIGHVLLKIGAMGLEPNVSKEEEEVLLQRFKACMAAMLANYADSIHPLFSFIINTYSMEQSFAAFMAGLEHDEAKALAADKAPSPSSHLARYRRRPTWRDPSWVSYSLVLLRKGRLPVRYEGIATALKYVGNTVTSMGGGAARGASHKSSIKNGAQSPLYNRYRSDKGPKKKRLILYSNWRVQVVSDKGSPFLFGLRGPIQYLVEAPLHEWKSSYFNKSGRVIWSDIKHRGGNIGSPAAQAIHSLSYWTPEERAARKKSYDREYASSDRGKTTAKRAGAKYYASDKGQKKRERDGDARRQRMKDAADGVPEAVVAQARIDELRRGQYDRAMKKKSDEKHRNRRDSADIRYHTMVASAEAGDEAAAVRLAKRKEQSNEATARSRERKRCEKLGIERPDWAKPRQRLSAHRR